MNLTSTIRGKKLVVYLVLIFAVLGIGFTLFSRNQSQKPTQLTAIVNNKSAFPEQMLAVKKGEALSDIAPHDSKAKETFIKNAQQKFLVRPAVPGGLPTPQEVVMGCIAEYLVPVHRRIKEDPNYHKNTELLRADQQKVRDYCYKTYSEDGQVPPAPKYTPPNVELDHSGNH